MEEILASIRKIIAEDSSGLRSPSAPSRPGTPYTPAPRSNVPSPSSAPAPQRGFMSREAFLKSSPPAEPEVRQPFAPLDPPRTAPADYVSTSASARLRPRDDFATKTPAPPKEPILPVDSQEPQKSSKLDAAPTLRAEPLPIADTTIEAATIETVEVVAVEDVLPVFGESSSAVLKAETSAPVAETLVSETSRIEAQLSELLSEDLNALRQNRAKTSSNETIVEADEMKAAPVEPTNKSKPDDSSASESVDPFAFDLGPSPFASKPESQRPVFAAPAAPAAAQPSAPAPQPAAYAPASIPDKPDVHAAKPFAPSAPSDPSGSAFDLSRSSIRPSYGESGYAAEPRFGEKSASAANGRTSASPANGSPFSGSSAPTSVSSEPPVKAAAPIISEPDAPASKSRPTFAFPSVSATLGPSRKLEPLSEAFKSAPLPPPSALESFAPAPEATPEPPRVTAPPFVSPAAEDARTEAVLQSMLPATTSDMGLDRPMEDAVADLLRPLLKTWLAENMPKIVERALRREMSERLLPGQKSPKE